MARFVLIGNSGSGKSTLAARLARIHRAMHLDLDSLAWESETPPTRRPIAECAREISSFMDAHDRWVIEGCYSDLAEAPLPRCSHLVFLNPGVDACIANARARRWEPHKYATREAQDANLEMLTHWIREYPTRLDEFSLAAHRAVFDRFAGEKIELISRDEIAAYGDLGPV